MFWPLASGRDCHVPRFVAFPCLGFIFPPVVVRCRFTSSYYEDQLQCRLAGANNCRRPVTAYEGYNDDSHMLAMQVLSLAPSNPCNSDSNRSCYQDQASPLFLNSKRDR